MATLEKLDAESAKSRLAEIDKALAGVNKLKKEREVLVKYLDAYQMVLKVYQNGNVHILDVHRAKKKAINAPKGSISLRSAIFQFLFHSDRKPFTNAELLGDCVSQGVISEAKRPLSVVDAYLYDLAQKGFVKKDPNKPSTWYWTGLTQ